VPSTATVTAPSLAACVSVQVEVAGEKVALNAGTSRSSSCSAKGLNFLVLCMEVHPLEVKRTRFLNFTRKTFPVFPGSAFFPVPRCGGRAIFHTQHDETTPGGCAGITRSPHVCCGRTTKALQ